MSDKKQQAAIQRPVRLFNNMAEIWHNNRKVTGVFFVAMEMKELYISKL